MIAWETCVFALLTDDKPPPNAPSNVRMWGKSIERIVGPSIYPMHKYVHFNMYVQLLGHEHGTVSLSNVHAPPTPIELEGSAKKLVV